LCAGPVFTFDDVVGIFPNFIDVAFFHFVAFEDVVRAPDNFGAALTLFHGEDRRKWVVFDGDRIYRLGKKMPVGVRQQKNRFFGMVDHPVRETRLIVDDQRNDVFAGDVFGSNDNKFIPGDARTEGDLPDLAAWNLAANRRTIKHSGESHVVDVLGFPGNFIVPFLAGNGNAYDAISGH
jgi:hypothetical protein